jgi:hypothetical protein
MKGVCKALWLLALRCGTWISWLVPHQPRIKKALRQRRKFSPELASFQFVLPAVDAFATLALLPGSNSQMLPVDSY